MYKAHRLNQNLICTNCSLPITIIAGEKRQIEKSGISVWFFAPKGNAHQMDGDSLHHPVHFPPVSCHSDAFLQWHGLVSDLLHLVDIFWLVIDPDIWIAMFMVE